MIPGININTNLALVLVGPPVLLGIKNTNLFLVFVGPLLLPGIKHKPIFGVCRSTLIAWY